MNKDLVNELAREAGFYVGDNIWPAEPDSDIDEQLIKLVSLIANRCIVKCESIYNGHIDDATRNDGRVSDIAFGRTAAAETLKEFIVENFGESQ